jgi:hypothetical protein
MISYLGMMSFAAVACVLIAFLMWWSGLFSKRESVSVGFFLVGVVLGHVLSTYLGRLMIDMKWL